MKLLPLVISTTLIVIVAIFSYVYIHLGLYKEVDFKSQDLGPYRIIFSHHIGPYHKIVESIEPVEKWAQANRVGCDLSFGEYLDDTETVAEERLQSNGGCIVSEEPRNLPTQISFREIPRRFYLTAEFAGAPSAGPMVVYPKALKWIAQNHYTLGGPVIEIYSVRNSKTQYLFPLGPKP